MSAEDNHGATDATELVDDSGLRSRVNGHASSGALEEQTTHEREDVHVLARKLSDEAGIDESQVCSEDGRLEATQLSLDLAAAELIAEAWGGPIPHPEQFNQYPPEVQERICLWTDSLFLDESKRQDRLVDAEIVQLRNGQAISTGLFILCIITATYLYSIGSTAGGSAMMLGPIGSIVARYLAPRRLLKRDSKPEREDKG